MRQSDSDLGLIVKTVIEMILQCLVGAEGKGRTHGRFDAAIVDW
jgi:hypothetical protein